MSGNYKRINESNLTPSSTPVIEENTNQKTTPMIPEITVPDNEKLGDGSANNVFDAVNTLRQRMMQLESRVKELSQMCPNTNTPMGNNVTSNVPRGY